MAPFRATLLVAIILCCSLLPESGFAADPDYRTYLTSESSNEIPLNEAQQYFDCSDTVYAVVEINNLRPGTHQLETIWRDPEGRKRETTRHPFHTAGGVARVWSWLRLHGPGGIAASVGRAFDPSLGMEEFIGEWTVRIAVDGEKIAVLKFEVLC